MGVGHGVPAAEVGAVAVAAVVVAAEATAAADRAADTMSKRNVRAKSGAEGEHPPPDFLPRRHRHRRRRGRKRETHTIVAVAKTAARVTLPIEIGAVPTKSRVSSRVKVIVTYLTVGMVVSLHRQHGVIPARPSASTVVLRVVLNLENVLHRCLSKGGVEIASTAQHQTLAIAAGMTSRY